MVTVSGLIYNLGLVVGPWFEGQLAQCLLGILNGNETFAAMAALCAGYLIAIAVVQGSRFIKRLYVRKFANNINRSMKQVLYANLVRKDKVELEQAGTGTLMTKAISDVDACAEGMRKFTTEIFDTGIALLAYAVSALALVVLGGGGAFAYIKFIRPKQASKVSADPDDYDFADEEEYINEDEPEPEEEMEDTK